MSVFIIFLLENTNLVSVHSKICWSCLTGLPNFALLLNAYKKCYTTTLYLSDNSAHARVKIQVGVELSDSGTIQQSVLFNMKYEEQQYK
jgi:hypothetical protein